MMHALRSAPLFRPHPGHGPGRVDATGLVGLLLLSALVACAEEGPIEAPDSQTLREALATASGGSVIHLTGEIYVGHFEVPSGVSIEGGGATVIGGEERAAVFRLVGGPEPTPTRLSDVTVRNDGVAVVATGSGALELDGVMVDVESIGGIFVEGVDRLTVLDSEAHGSLDEGNISSLSSLGQGIDASRIPIAGLVVSQVPEFVIDGFQMSGFAGFGAIFKDSDGYWIDGTLSRWVGTGVLVEGGDLTLLSVQIGDDLRSNDRVIPTNGIVVTKGANLDSQSLSLTNIGGIGILQDDATSRHDDLHIRRLSRAGLWVQNSMGDATEKPALRLVGISALEENAGLGLYMNNVRGLDADCLHISHTVERRELAGYLGIQPIGDGIQMLGASGRVRITEGRFSGNMRVGFLIDGANGALPDFDLDVDIDRGELTDASDTYGLLVQNSADTEMVLDDNRIDAMDFAEQDARARADGLALATVPMLDKIAGLAQGGSFIGEQGLVSESGQLARDARISAFGDLVDEGDEP